MASPGPGRRRLQAGLKAAAFVLVMAPLLTHPLPFLPPWLPPSIPRLGLVLLGTTLATRLECRSMASAGLSMDRAWWEDLLRGAGAAVLAAAALLLLLGALGGRWAPGGPIKPALWQVGAFVSIAAFEESAFRGFLFFRTQEAIGTVPAVLLNAVAFAFAHGLHGTFLALLMPSLSLALASGILAGFTAATGRTGAAIGLHFAWNTVLGAFFGCSVAGHEVPAFLVSTLKGPNWVTGGSFGPASGVPGLILLALTIPLLRRVLASPERSENV